ncbi:hypothetical protein Tco_0266805 [Tanacetum coccineum]
MRTYLKNMEGYKLNDLKLKDFDSIQEIFDRALKRQKVEDNKEIAKLKQLMKIIPDEEEVAIDAIPLAVKSPSIVGWNIYKEGGKSYYQIMRAKGKSQMYMFFSQMLKIFNREDLEDLYKLVKAKFESTKPVEDLDLLLWGDLKTLFEPHVEDAVWRNEQAYKVLDWKLYNSLNIYNSGDIHDKATRTPPERLYKCQNKCSCCLETLRWKIATNLLYHGSRTICRERSLSIHSLILILRLSNMGFQYSVENIVDTHLNWHIINSWRRREYRHECDISPDTTPIEEIAATGWGDEFSDD